MIKFKEIKYSSKFIKNFKKLPRNIKLKAIKQEELLKRDVFDPKLKTHKLKGVLEGCYSFSVDYSNRIVFTVEDEKTIVFLDIGNHSIYK